MRKMNASPKNIDEYISICPEEVQKKLQQIREKILSVVPEAEEAMKYAIPTFVYHGNLVHFVAYKNHIGFYPAPSGIRHFSKEFSDYNTSKGAVQFPIDRPVPLQLIGKVVKFRKLENEKKLKS
ncbi:iron chaperone [Fulvivirga ligni]|uniref:iron chaperone n=1 Tax=Fulvivirga ligni TaxID=2904246 RepID=UPI001F2F817B|nr:DUF1801 domain-containing protein [Fulvivirga ligni]UII23997.1 DUF1801 domain-containing protein [Fulvivirga ligni]